jgi:hypothetical protein
MSREPFKPGEPVCRWWDSGAMGMDLQPLVVVRVNRLTVTVETKSGNRFRMHPDDLVDRDWEW